MKVKRAIFRLLALSAAPVWAVVKPARPVPEMVQSFWTEGKITVVEVSAAEAATRQSGQAVGAPSFLAILHGRINYLVETGPPAEENALVSKACAKKRIAKERKCERAKGR